MSFQFHPHAIKFTIYKKKKNLVIVHICSYAAKRENGSYVPPRSSQLKIVDAVPK